MAGWKSSQAKELSRQRRLILRLYLGDLTQVANWAAIQTRGARDFESRTIRASEFSIEPELGHLGGSRAKSGADEREPSAYSAAQA